MEPRIIYTYTDEAPMLATHALLPIIQTFSRAAGITVEVRDISLAARILAAFPDSLPPDRRVNDALAELGELVKLPDANIIKLPNISASVPQIQAAVKELQSKGYTVPDYPETPRTDEELSVRQRFDKVKGSAVNPVIREGNSDRRCAPAVKQYARKNPHSMGSWSKDSKTHVSSMSGGDFYGSEKSVTLPGAGSFRIEFSGIDGSVKELKGKTTLEAGEILDSAVMRRKELRSFLETQIIDAREKNVLFSIHLKATMMKVSDPVIFGHAVSVFFNDVFTKHREVLEKLGVNPDLGLGDLEFKLEKLDVSKREAILADIRSCRTAGPDLAMVNSERGITNLHVPSDIIIDASMPAAIRNSGKMWGPDGKAQDMKAVIPDRSYSSVYQAAIDFCRENGAFDPKTMGSVANVGLMAKQAEEYGSHDKTFLAPGKGTIRAVDQVGKVIFGQDVEEGDLFRMCQVKSDAIIDWVKLAVRRSRATGTPAVFWLDEKRSHDNQVIRAVKNALAGMDTSGLEILIMNPADACRYTLKRSSEGKDTISVTGNVLRDYLTDLFPILELGTSAKMLSIVPLMNGGGLFETGAGGSAPKHVEQLLKENHLRWDSLGEYLALAVSYEHLAGTFGNARAALLGTTLDTATGALLENRKSPSPKTGEIDNRGSHYYLARYWAEALAAQDEDRELKTRFAPAAKALADSENQIIKELSAVQGTRADIGGYYRPDAALTDSVMRPSGTFNRIISTI